MKRQRTEDSKKLTPFEALQETLNNMDLSCDQLETLKNQLTHLYAYKASRIVQQLPTELWYKILAQTNPAFSEWFQLRTVCKAWNTAISKIELNFMDPGRGLFNFNHLLKSFKFSHLTISDNDRVEIPLLSNLRSLAFIQSHRSFNGAKPHEETWRGLSSLTNLISLVLNSPSLSTASLACLTNLSTLTLCSPSITSISTLTKLKKLDLGRPFILTQDDLKDLSPNLVVSTNDPSFFCSGRGTLQEAGTGVVYTGEWSFGRAQGRGTLTYANGERHEGMFEHNQLTGRGTRFYPCGDKFDGEWANGKRQGPGKYWAISDYVYEGNWVDDWRHGHGIASYPNGDSYTGNFDHGQRSGFGTYEFKDGTQFSGMWHEGKPSAFQNPPLTEPIRLKFCKEPIVVGE